MPTTAVATAATITIPSSRALKSGAPGPPGLRARGAELRQKYGRRPARATVVHAKKSSPLACHTSTAAQTGRAAQALHIHPNTLLYRVRRFEQISGHSRTSAESLAGLGLALRPTAAVPDAASRPAPA
jgi:hypothetical protein